MQASIVIPVGESDEALMAMLGSLVDATDDDYEVLFAVSPSTPFAIRASLAQLEGDLTLMDVADQRAATCINAALPLAKSELLVMASVESRFASGWLDQLQAELQQSILATPELPAIDAIAVSVGVLRKCGGLDPSLGNDSVFTDFMRRLQQKSEQVQRAADMRIPGDVLGHRVGESVASVLAAGLQGARTGELPVEDAERLRERLWQEEERRLLLSARAGRDVCWTDEGEVEPLITVRIATHNRATELMEIALPSALNQSYERLDILVVGDHTDDATVKAMSQVRDARVRFINLPSPSAYPTDKWGHWLVHGSPPMNLGIDLAQGSWINPMDDDDEMTPDHVEVMFREARAKRLEFVWSQTLMETPDGWQVLGAAPLGPGATTAGAVMWSSGLRFMKMSTTCWKINEPHDGNMWRRMHEIGVRMGFLPKITYRYYLGANLRENLQAPA